MGPPDVVTGEMRKKKKKNRPVMGKPVPGCGCQGVRIPELNVSLSAKWNWSSSSVSRLIKVSMPSMVLKLLTTRSELLVPTVYDFVAHYSGSRGRACTEGLHSIERDLERLDSSRNRRNPRTVRSARWRGRSCGKLLRTSSGSWAADEVERDFGAGPAGDHGLGPLPGIAADDAVGLGRWPRRDLLEQDAALSAG